MKNTKTFFKLRQIHLKRYWLAALSFLFLYLSVSQAYSQNTKDIRLNLSNATWISSMIGRSTTAPVATSYGTALVSADRIIYCYTDDGSKILQKTTGRRTNGLLTSLQNDFFTTVTDGEILNFINPSGITLWSSHVGFTITENTFQGRDGRLIVRGVQEICCYSLTGVRKWKIKLEQLSSLPMCELNDGSIIVFLNSNKGINTAQRISPFGQMMEEVVLEKAVISAGYCDDGVAVAFSDGSLELIAVKNNETKNSAKTIWSLSPSTVSSSGAQVYFKNITEKKLAVVYKSGGGSSATIVETESGQIESTLNFSGIDVSQLSLLETASSGGNDVLIAADNNFIAAVNFAGEIVWQAPLPSKTASDIPWEKIIYTKNNYLIFFTTNWAVVAFKTDENILAEKQNKKRHQKKDYSSFYLSASRFQTETFLTEAGDSFKDGGISAELSKGDYADGEIIYNSIVMSAVRSYNNMLNSAEWVKKKENNIFLQDAQETDALIETVPLFGTSDAANALASLLKAEKNSAHVKTLLRAVSYFPYDPDGEILRALKNLPNLISAKEESVQIMVCVAVYNLCQFMGEPFINAGGRDLLAERTLSTNYNSNVTKNARKYLSMIANSPK